MYRRMSTFLNLSDLNLHVRIDYEYAAKIPTINFENRLTFVQFISNIRDTISGEITDSITVTEDAKTIDLVKNGFLCIDLFDGLNLNERRFVNAVITELTVMINNDPMLQQEFTEVSAQIENYFEKNLYYEYCSSRLRFSNFKFTLQNDEYKNF